MSNICIIPFSGGNNCLLVVGTYVFALRIHLEHWRRNAGRCLEALHFIANRSSSVISEHRDCYRLNFRKRERGKDRTRFLYVSMFYFSKTIKGNNKLVEVDNESGISTLSKLSSTQEDTRSTVQKEYRERKTLKSKLNELRNRKPRR